MASLEEQQDFVICGPHLNYHVRVCRSGLGKGGWGGGPAAGDDGCVLDYWRGSLFAEVVLDICGNLLYWVVKSCSGILDGWMPLVFGNEVVRSK